MRSAELERVDESELLVRHGHEPVAGPRGGRREEVSRRGRAQSARRAGRAHRHDSECARVLQHCRVQVVEVAAAAVPDAHPEPSVRRRRAARRRVGRRRLLLVLVAADPVAVASCTELTATARHSAGHHESRLRALGSKRQVDRRVAAALEAAGAERESRRRIRAHNSAGERVLLLLPTRREKRLLHSHQVRQIRVAVSIPHPISNLSIFA